MPCGSIRCTYHQLKYSSPNRSTKNPKKQDPHKIAYLSENGGLGWNKSGEWAKSRKGSDEDRKSNRTRQKKNKRRDIEKSDQTGSPEIPDSGETSEIPGLPSGGGGGGGVQSTNWGQTRRRRSPRHSPIKIDRWTDNWFLTRRQPRKS